MTRSPSSITRDHLAHALTKLPELPHTVFFLHAVEDHDFITIAATLDIDVATVEWLLARALILLDDLLHGSVGDGHRPGLGSVPPDRLG